MANDGCAEEAARLLATRAELDALLRFARAHDTSVTLRSRWGDAFDARLDGLLRDVEAAHRSTEPFGRTVDEVLLCMAVIATRSPLIGTSESAAHARLTWLLGALPGVDPTARWRLSPSERGPAKMTYSRSSEAGKAEPRGDASVTASTAHY